MLTQAPPSSSPPLDPSASNAPSGTPSPSGERTPGGPADLIGRRFGHVRLETLLDRGGMGEVYRGFDEALERPVAVKTIRADDRPSAAARDRFRREARLLSKLDHPNICRVHDLIRRDPAEAGDEPTDLLVLEFVEGEKLGERLRRGLKPAEKLRIAREIAAALAAAHRLRIVHRDLKPSNVMIRSNGQVKVLDFGLARSLDAPLSEPPVSLGPTDTGSMRVILDDDGNPISAVPTDPGSSSQGFLVGTLEYMSPEQALGETVTEASDLYAFGLVLQWLFTERSPYGTDHGHFDLMRRVLAGDTEPLRAPRGVSRRSAGRHGRERLDPDLLLLVEELKRSNPEHRPTAERCVERLARIAGKPARRRARRTLWGVALAAIALTVATVAWNRQQERQRTEIALAFSQDAKDMEWTMRLGHSIPLHPLVPHAREVRRQMNSVSGRLQTYGDISRGPAEYALGRGHLVLGELGAARARLENAWSLGFRRPEVALALGDVLGRLYRRAADEILLETDPRWARDRHDWVGATYRAPAAARLRLAQRPGLGAGGLAEALLALYTERPDHARQLARRVAEAVPWLYEAHLVAGDAEAARFAWRLAADEYAAAAEVGPSDPRVHLASCRLGVLRAAAGENLEPEVHDEIETACDRAILVASDEAEASLARARLWALGGNLPAALDAARDGVERAHRAGSDEAAGHRTLAALYLRAEELELALAHGRRAAVLAPDDPGGHALLGRAALRLSLRQARRGAPLADLEDSLDAAADGLQAYRRLRPEFVPVYAALGRAYLLRADLRSVAPGEASDDALIAARRALARGRRLGPNDPEILELLDALARAENEPPTE